MEDLIERLRSAFLGHNLLLTEVLDTNWVIPLFNSRAIASQLIFVLVDQNDWGIEEITAAECWLQAAIHYILRKTNKEEHTFHSLLMLTSAPDDFLDFSNTSRFDKPDHPQFLTTQVLEQGILALMESKGMLEGAKRALDAAERMLGSSSTDDSPP